MKCPTCHPRPRQPLPAPCRGMILVAMMAAACSTSNPEVPDTRSEDAGNGSTGVGGGLHGADGAAAALGDETGSDPSLDADVGDASSLSGPCPEETTLTLAAHIWYGVSWPATSAALASTGTEVAHIRLLVHYDVSGNQLHGYHQMCSLSMPELQLSAIGKIATGGSKLLVQVSPEVFAKPSMPRFDAFATLAGWDPPAAFTVANPGVAMMGFELPPSVDPLTFKWPSSSWGFPQGTNFTDSDGDSKPGVTAIPQSGEGYVFPPTSVGLGGLAPSADEVYLISRSQLSFDGVWTSCHEISGSAKVILLDNHVVGCHVRDGADCTAGAANTQADFVDQNRSVLTSGPASFLAKKVPSTATCADVLAALP